MEGTATVVVVDRDMIMIMEVMEGLMAEMVIMDRLGEEVRAPGRISPHTPLERGPSHPELEEGDQRTMLVEVAGFWWTEQDPMQTTTRDRGLEGEEVDTMMTAYRG